MRAYDLHTRSRSRSWNNNTSILAVSVSECDSGAGNLSATSLKSAITDGVGEVDVLAKAGGIISGTGTVEGRSLGHDAGNARLLESCQQVFRSCQS